MDNVSFHHSHKVQQTIREKEWECLFVPPYSPVFNPIEGVFSIVKRHYQKCLHIQDSFKQVTSCQIKGFFRGSFAATHRLS